MWEVPSMGVFIYLTQDNLKMGSRDEAFTLTGLEIGLIQVRPPHNMDYPRTRWP